LNAKRERKSEGINMFAREDGFRPLYAQPSGTDEKLLLGDRQQALMFE
jgi:hypothetical protein